MSQWACKKCGESVDENTNSDICLKCLKEEFYELEEGKQRGSMVYTVVFNNDSCQSVRVFSDRQKAAKFACGLDALIYAETMDRGINE